MDLLKLLNILIGLVTIYLVCALAVTALNEGIAALLSSRARWLHKGLVALLTPAGIPASSQAGHGLSPSQMTRQALDGPWLAQLSQSGLLVRYRPSYVPAWTLLQSLLTAANTGTQGGGKTVFNSVQAIREAADRLPAGSPLRVGLDNLLQDFDGSLVAFRQAFEAWFAEFETQLGAWYKQKTHLVVAALSLALAGMLNVDTVQLARKMSSDPQALQQVLAVADRLGALPALPGASAPATAAAGSGPSGPSSSPSAGPAPKASATRSAASSAASSPPGSASVAPATAASAGASAGTAPASDAHKALPAAPAASAVDDGAQIRAIAQRTREQLVLLSEAGVPLGWPEGEWTRLWTAAGSGLLTKGLGLLISALAISLGAPFWFDLLKQLVAIRSVGQNLSEQQQKAEDQRRADAAAAAAAEATRRR